MQKRIQVQLTKDSINSAIKEITDYKHELLRKVGELGETLVSEGIFSVKTWIIAYDAVETGNLLDSIEGVFNTTTGKGFIRTNSDHAAYVEYGTGVRGAEASGTSPDKPSDWDYDINNHGHDGWYYYDHGWRRWTKGMPPRPFMWQAAQELADKASELVKVKLSNG